MRNLHTIFLTSLLAFAGSLSAAEIYNGTCNIHFKGTSTLHDFEGTVASQKLQVVTDDKTWSATASVPVAKIDTDNKKRDKKMLDMFESEQFADISGSVEKAPFPGKETRECKLQLKIRDHSEPVTLTMRDWQLDESKLHAVAHASVSLEEFDLKPPSVMGVVKVGDTVDLTLTVDAKHAVE